MAIVTLTIDGQQLTAHDDASLLHVAREHGIDIPTLCHLDGLSDVGACRICLVEIEGQSRLVPACIARPVEGMIVHTDTPRLQRHRRTVVELLACEGNHQCAVCVSNEHCELQDLATRVGLQFVSVPYLYPAREVDASHPRFVMDHNRCVLCTRCLRVCEEVEGAHTWDVAGRGIHCRMVADLDVPWGKAESCTSCGKCVAVCPTGALFEKGTTVSEMKKRKEHVRYIVNARQRREWDSSLLEGDE